MKKIIIFAILTFLFVAIYYTSEEGLFLGNLAGFAYNNLKPGVDLNFATALINKELGSKRDTFYNAGDCRIQLNNGALVNKLNDKYHMYCYAFFWNTSNPCNSAYGKIYFTYIKEKGINYYKIVEINYFYSPRPFLGYRIRIQKTNPGNKMNYFFEKKVHRCGLLQM